MQTNIKRLLTFFLLFISVLNLTLINMNDSIVKASATITLTNWDSDNFGATSGTNSYIHWERKSGTDFNIVDNTVEGITTYSGTHSLHMHYSTGGDDGYINLSQNYAYISSITFYFYIASGVNNANDNLRFIDYNGDFVLEIMIFYNGANYLARYVDVGNVTQTFATLTGGGLHKVTITHLTGNTMNYSIWNGTGILKGGKDGSSMSSDTWTNYHYIFMYNGGQESLFYLDDILITYSSSAPTEGEYYEGYEDYIPDCGIEGYAGLFCGLTQKYGYEYLEMEIQSKMNITIMRFDIYVGINQYNLVSNDLSDYELYINGQNVGSPTSWIPISGGNYILSWYTSTGWIILDEYPVFELSSNESYIDATYGEYHWFTSIMSSMCGLPSLLHGQSNLYGDGFINGYPIKYPEYYGYQNEISPYIKFYYLKSEIIQPSPVALSDELFVTVNGNDVSITVTTMSSGSSLHIYNTDTGAENTSDDYPITLYGSGTWFFKKHIIDVGNYNVTINRSNAVIKSKSFIISNTISRYDIYTNPNPSENGKSFNIHYLYNSLTGNNGLIVISETPYLNDTESRIEAFIITNSSDYNVKEYTISDGMGIYYIIMAEYITGEGYQFIKNYQHIVTDTISHSNYVSVKYSKFYMLTMSRQTITYEHNFLGDSHIYLLIDGSIYKSLSDSYTGTIFFAVNYAKTYNVSLALYDGTSYFTLAYTGFTSFLSYEGGEEKTPLPHVDKMTGAILGIIITTAFALLPLLISLSFKKSPNIPPMLYMLSAGLGLSFCVMLGFFDLWVPFFLIVIGIVITVILYLRGE